MSNSGLVLTGLTRGDGAGSDDGTSAANASLPSWAPTGASGMPDDFNFEVFEAHETVEVRPEWVDDHQATDGTWANDACGGGGAGSEGPADEEINDAGKGGCFGIVTANWGGNWKDPDLMRHMNFDLKTCPGHIICVQEAEPVLLGNMRSTSIKGDSCESADTRGDGGKKPPRQENQFVGVRGLESGSSLMICGRKSVVVGVRLKLFRRRVDGMYRVSTRKNHKKNTKTKKQAMTRIMVATLKMRYFKIRGSGEDGVRDFDPQEITVVNVHLHCMTAKGDVSGGSTSRKLFWDELAQHIVEFGARFLCGDFNMALFSVIPELRARGFQINLAAWYCWQQSLESQVRADSCGMFHIGPCTGIRLCLCPSLCGISVDPRPDHCSMMMKTLPDSEGKGKQTQEPYSLPKFDKIGQGFPLTSYLPKVDEQKEAFLKWTFTVALSPLSSVVTDNVKLARDNRRWFPFPLDTTIGKESWNWPALPPFRQKLVSTELFDPQERFFHRGAHMPLMGFIGSSGDNRRTPEAQRRRTFKATLRGQWQVEKRQPWQPKAEGKGNDREVPGRKGKGSGQPVVTGYWDKCYPWQWIEPGLDGSSPPEAPLRWEQQSSTGWSSNSWQTHGGGVSEVVHTPDPHLYGWYPW